MLPGLLDGPGIEKVSFCGPPMGGMAGRWLGSNAPERLERLALADTTSYFPNKETWRERMGMAENDDVSAIAGASIGRRFTPGCVVGDDNADVIGNARGFIMQTTLERRLGCGVAIRDMDFRAEPRQIGAPTLVIIGEKDPASLPRHGQVIAAGIPGARTAVTRDAGHLSSIEPAKAFNSTPREFLAF